MSGIEVAGAVLAVVPVLRSSINFFKHVPKGKLPETFEDVRSRLPLILVTLQACMKYEEKVKTLMDPENRKALEDSLHHCDEKVRDLREILEKVIPSERDAWKRYLKLARGLGKERMVEELMLSITDNVQIIANTVVLHSTFLGDKTEREDIIKEMKLVKCLGHEEQLESSSNTFKSGKGAQADNVLSASGQQINDDEDLHAQKSVIKQKGYYSNYKGPVGAHLDYAPHIAPESFIARDLELDELRQILEPGDVALKQRLLVIGGNPGAGKTQLAIAYAQRHLENYESILWVNAESELKLRNCLLSIARQIFDLQEPTTLANEDILILTRTWLSDPKNTRWLLIFDDYDHSEEFRIEQYYPSVSHGSIVITTRQPDLVAVTARCVRTTLCVKPFRILVTGIRALGLSIATIPLIIHYLDALVHETGHMGKMNLLWGYPKDFARYSSELAMYHAILLDTAERVLDGMVESEHEVLNLMKNPLSDEWEDPILERQLRIELGRNYDVFEANTRGLWERLDRLSTNMGISENMKKPISTELPSIRSLRKVLSQDVYEDLIENLRATASIRIALERSNFATNVLISNELGMEGYETKAKYEGGGDFPESELGSETDGISTPNSLDAEGGEIKTKDENGEAFPESDLGSRTDGISTQIFSSVHQGTNTFTEDTSLTHKSGAPGNFKRRTDENHAENVEGLYDSQTQYSASDTSSLPPPEGSGYMISLAKELFDAVRSSQSNEETMKHVSGMLPDLLRAFALKMGYKAGTRIQLDISFFVHRYRSRIQTFFEDMLPLEIDPGLVSEKIETRQFAIDRFLLEPETVHGNPGEVSSLISPEPEDYDDAFEDDMESEPDTGPYREFILGTSAYSWLIATLQKEAIITRSSPDIMDEIGKGILKALPSFHKVSRRQPSQGYRGIFELDWDLLHFLEQQSTDPPHEAVKKAITLTGTSSDGQAITTGAYLSQTWPTTGDIVMQLVVDVVKNTDHQAMTTFPDGTSVDVKIRESKFIVIASGTGDSLAEVAQQFAWLGSALQPSHVDYGVVSCTPFIRSSRRLTSKSFSTILPGVLPSLEFLYVIGFKMESYPSGEKLPGQCWHDMFRNPVVVRGYPILTKKEDGLGLEMPLNMMAGLTESDRATEFDGKVFIKGFSVMLVATKIVEDLLVWHYFYNSDGSRISYLDQSLQGVEKISLIQLETYRHVVGWCVDCKYNAGAENAQYDIGGTGLPQPHAGCMLDKVSLSGGKIITGGLSFSIFLRDNPPHLARNGYVLKLKWIYTKYVMLWDEKDKRGWLVNGISALLHLVRASLRHYSKDDFSSAFLFDFEKMMNSNELKPNSAIKVLLHEGNKELEIYPGKSERSEEEEISSPKNNTGYSKTQKKKRGYYLFEDLVEQHFTILEQIIEYHAHKAGENGVNLKLRVRKHLEGWDFVELATDHDPRPRVATLEAMGWGWVDFIRSIGAVTLFGRDFGEIIQPVDFDGMCPSWKKLPTQKYYLAASVREMKDIMEKHGKGCNGLDKYCGAGNVAFSTFGKRRNKSQNEDQNENAET
ncbi:hypothetical protein N7478_007607 [Penicillium angulare]|uniref:uncharacterized protein n=1 Tax=Penicillium angulare TaxID=116970 RepID=UPI00253FC150|nr:uncharacterized protein N7478_007607 [Penicillium angulare]KAJ5272482.1 hypothetical protein N7478_007607 [Penicillium angulare]